MSDAVNFFLTLHDKLRQQRGKKDGFRQTDKTAANLCGRHRGDWQLDAVDPDRLLPSTDAKNDS